MHGARRRSGLDRPAPRAQLGGAGPGRGAGVSPDGATACPSRWACTRASSGDLDDGAGRAAGRGAGDQSDQPARGNGAAQAVAAGAHVLVEKPISHTLDGVAALLDEAAQRQVVMVGYNLRFHPGWPRLRELAAAQAPSASRCQRAGRSGRVPARTGTRGRTIARATAARRDLGGGPVLTFSHELDACTGCWARPQRHRHGRARERARDRHRGHGRDRAELRRRGAGPVHVDYVRRPPRRILEIVGEEGVVRWEYDDESLAALRARDTRVDLEEGDPRFAAQRHVPGRAARVRRPRRGQTADLVDRRRARSQVLAIAWPDRARGAVLGSSRRWRSHRYEHG